MQENIDFAQHSLAVSVARYNEWPQPKQAGGPPSNGNFFKHLPSTVYSSWYQ